MVTCVGFLEAFDTSMQGSVSVTFVVFGSLLPVPTVDTLFFLMRWKLLAFLANTVLFRKCADTRTPFTACASTRIQVCCVRAGRTTQSGCGTSMKVYQQVCGRLKAFWKKCLCA